MDRKITETLKDFKGALETLGIRVNRIIVFGSYAKGEAKKHSDIDVIVISHSFKDMNLFERFEILGLALGKAKIMEPIEPLGYTEEEFLAKGEGTFIGDEVKTKGIEIK
ncbi:MAG: hypothetical protein AMJ89_03510 [candidate division Zixibacteria bacterium SM23_73]|nr:MAG: hypothetical protein AMJ89_03510 [candidate division Zixibacteria bacterium SM23_73]